MIKKFNKFLSLNKLNRLRNYLTSNCIELLIIIKEVFSNIGNLSFLTVFLLGLIPIFLDFEANFFGLYACFIICLFLGLIFEAMFEWNFFRGLLLAISVIVYPVKCTLVVTKEEQIKLLEKEKESKEILEFIGLNKEEAADCKKRLLTQDKKKIRDCIKILKDDNYF